MVWVNIGAQGPQIRPGKHGDQVLLILYLEGTCLSFKLSGVEIIYAGLLSILRVQISVQAIVAS